MFKDIAKAVMVRALCVITAMALFAVYASVTNNIRDRKNRRVEASKVGAAVNHVKQLLDGLTAKIEAVLPRFPELTPIEQLNLKTELRTECLANAKTIENGSVRDIYLTSVEQMLDRAFTAKA
jgi:hypothetical protein